jgi:hypothetical protein
MGLKGGHLLAQRGLGDVKDGRRAGEASDVNDLDERMKPACVQGPTSLAMLILSNLPHAALAVASYQPLSSL